MVSGRRFERGAADNDSSLERGENIATSEMPIFEAETTIQVVPNTDENVSTLNNSVVTSAAMGHRMTDASDQVSRRAI